MTDWLIAITPTGIERRATVALTDLGFEVWYPTRLVTFKTKHMKKPAERRYPQWPGYVFARGTGSRPVFKYERVRDEERHGRLERTQVDTEPHEQHWRELDGLDDIRAILCNDGRPVIVRAAEIEAAKAYFDALANTPVDAATWRARDHVRVTSGPWSVFGGTGLVAEDEHRGRVKVAFELFGHTKVVEMPVHQLARAA